MSGDTNDATDDLLTDHFDGDDETVTDAWEGVALYTSWGYNQTNVDFARIVEVSDSGRTVLARCARADRVDVEAGSERLQPTGETYGDEFRLHVREVNGDPMFRGSYPHATGEMDDGTRRDGFMPFIDDGEGTVHQTAPGYRH